MYSHNHGQPNLSRNHNSAGLLGHLVVVTFTASFCLFHALMIVDRLIKQNSASLELNH